MQMKCLFYAAVIFISGISTASGQAKIELTIKDSQDSVGYLGYHFADKRFVLDTVHLEGRKAVFTQEESFKPGLYFYYTPNVYFEFIVNEDDIVLETTGENYGLNMVVIKSEENKIFKEMQQFVASRRKVFDELTKQKEEMKDDSLKLEEIEAEIRSIDAEVKEFQIKLASQNEGTFASRMIHAMQKPKLPDSLMNSDADLQELRYEFYKNHFFDNVNIADAGLLRTPIYHQKVMEYFNDVVVQVPDSLIKEVDWFLDEASKDKEVFRYALITLTSHFETSPIMGLDRVFVHLVEKYYLMGAADWVEGETIKKMADRIATMKPNFIGNPAPPLTLNDTLFSTVALYDINAEYTVLYFYDPDCGHCKKKTPVLFDAYNTVLRNENVEVLAICITTDTDRWKEYIRENQLDWVNLADSYNKSNFRYYYDIRSTPTIYILDKDKKIIAKKLDAEQVEPFIHQLQQQLHSGGD